MTTSPCGMAGRKNDWQRRPSITQHPVHRRTAHVRQAYVQDDDVGACLLDRGICSATGPHDGDDVIVALQLQRQTGSHDRVILDQQDLAAFSGPGQASTLLLLRRHATSVLLPVGLRDEDVESRSFADLALDENRPAVALEILCTIERPSPVPRGFVVNNGSKIRRRS